MCFLKIYSNFLFTYSFLLNWCIFVSCNNVVNTENGLVSGTLYKTKEGKEVIAFLGLPYAKPPIDNLRFSEPQPVENWTGVRSAHTLSKKCIQLTYYNSSSRDYITGDEDCLYLNVWTPSISSDAELDVIFYIHGGAFMFGSGELLKPDYILQRHDVVFVTINYRLGPFGFMTTEDGVIPGNLGLKDQLLALKWVHNNIGRFGGDKNKITLAGNSAGGASVHLHYLSPLSSGLFTKGISFSGTAFCPWVLVEHSREKTQTLANSVNCSSQDSMLLLECMRSKPAKALPNQVEHLGLFMPWYFNPFSPFGVVVELPSNSAFLRDNPFNLVEEGKVQDVPWLTSMTTEEGLYPGATFITSDKHLKELEQNWELIAPHLLDYNQTIPYKHLNQTSRKIRTFYLDDGTISKDNVNKLVNIISDRLFVVEIERATRLQASVTKSPVYFYRFGYRGNFSLSNAFCKCADNLGASHMDDMTYLLKAPFKISPLGNEEDKAMVEVMVNIIISFVKTGVPVINPDTKWDPVSSSAAKAGNITHVFISDSRNIVQMQSEDLGNRNFWDSLQFEELWNRGTQSNDYKWNEL